MGYPAAFLVYCQGIPLTLTSLRKTVLYALWQADKPLKAYDILNSLLDEQPNATAAAVYRALGFFVTAGVVHKIDSIQSYTLCGEPETKLCSEVLMVCSMCHGVREIQDEKVRNAVTHLAHLDAFSLSDDPIELRGMCNTCA
ncbi:MAG: transcriptional repressor [Gammaproteobacteria bacterium]|nr:transcriptional repressor [Gammaproteobacteria bacterium]MCH9715717.1 transcriptional repressor [Gammaproteobacteria bacterium]MCH9762912.1 transcriptional repressor [Gammaproteobacteria bacterium]